VKRGGAAFASMMVYRGGNRSERFHGLPPVGASFGRLRKKAVAVVTSSFETLRSSG
jgi:hypothetical protein